MILEKQSVLETEQVEGEIKTPTEDRRKLYTEESAITTSGEAVTIQKLVGEFTRSEIEHDIENLANQILDLQNQKRDKELILAEFEK